MRYRFISWLSATLLVFAHPLAAQLGVRKDAQALAVLADAFSVMLTPGTTIQDAVVQGSIEMGDGAVGSVTLESKGTDSIRREVTSSSDQMTYVARQGLGYRIINGDKTSLPLWVTAFQGPEHIPALSRIADFPLAQVKVVYLGLEEVADQTAHHIRLSVVGSTTDDLAAQTVELMSEFHVYVNTKSKLIEKTETFIFSPETASNRTKVDTYYSDYRRVGSVLVPYRISQFIMGQKLSDITVTSVTLNTGVPDTRFE